MALGLREDVTFQLEGFSPLRLCALPGLGCLVAVGAAGDLRSLDLTSGTVAGEWKRRGYASGVRYRHVLVVQVYCSISLGADTPQVASPVHRLHCCYHVRSKKFVAGSGRILGARGATGGSVMLQTLLQPPAEEDDTSVTIELTLTEASSSGH